MWYCYFCIIRQSFYLGAIIKPILIIIEPLKQKTCCIKTTIIRTIKRDRNKHNLYFDQKSFIGGKTSIMMFRNDNIAFAKFR